MAHLHNRSDVINTQQPAYLFSMTTLSAESVGCGGGWCEECVCVSVGLFRRSVCVYLSLRVFEEFELQQ